MKKIYTGIDIGSNTIKVATFEIIEDQLYCLASTSIPSKGVKRGWVVEKEKAVESLQKAIREVEKVIGVTIDKAVVAIPSYDRTLTIAEGEAETTGEDGTVSYDDIMKTLQDAVLGKVEEKRELVMVSPISFQVDDEDPVKNPIHQKGSKLAVKAVIATVPRENVTNILSVVKECKVEAVDFCFGEVGDYYCAKNKIYDKEVGAVINIGYETTKIAVYNKGIMIKDDILSVGSKNIDKDIKYVYHVDKKTSTYLKENFAVANKRYADVNDLMEIAGENGQKRMLNQLEISEVVESRLIQILRLAKNQINLLTNREISYIIITGGISELAGFQYVVDNILGREANTLSITTMGIRSNKYSSVAGIVKYFYDKLEMRGKSYTMLDDDKMTYLSSGKRSGSDSANETIVSKVFGYFFDND